MIKVFLGMNWFSGQCFFLFVIQLFAEAETPPQASRVLLFAELDRTVFPLQLLFSEADRLGVVFLSEYITNRIIMTCFPCTHASNTTSVPYCRNLKHYVELHQFDFALCFVRTKIICQCLVLLLGKIIGTYSCPIFQVALNLKKKTVEP
jgi:hypothetical protein